MLGKFPVASSGDASCRSRGNLLACVQVRQQQISRTLLEWKRRQRTPETDLSLSPFLSPYEREFRPDCLVCGPAAVVDSEGRSGRQSRYAAQIGTIRPESKEPSWDENFSPFLSSSSSAAAAPMKSLLSWTRSVGDSTSFFFGRHASMPDSRRHAAGSPKHPVGSISSSSFRPQSVPTLWVRNHQLASEETSRLPWAFSRQNGIDMTYPWWTCRPQTPKTSTAGNGTETRR